MCDPGVSSEMVCFSTEHVSTQACKWDWADEMLHSGSQVDSLKAAIVKNPGITTTALSADDRLAFNSDF